MILKHLLIYILLIIIPVTQSAFAEEIGIEDILFLGVPPSSAGRGSTFATGRGSEHFFYNPAAVAGNEKTSFSLNYSSLPFQLEYSYPGISAGFPTSCGVIGISAKTLVIPGSDEPDFATGFALGIGKNLTPGLSIGASAKSFYGKAEERMLYGGLTLGMILQSPASRSGSCFGIFNPALGLSLNTGLTRGEGSGQLDRNSLNLGYSFGFLRAGGAEFSFFNEVTALESYTEFPVKAGLEAAIKRSLVLRAGMIYPDYHKMRVVSLGLGYLFTGKTIAGSFNYSAVHYKNRSFIHSLGLTMDFTTEDTRPPETVIGSDYEQISPNDDGNRDYATFRLKVSDKSRIKGWKLQILDEENNVIREYHSPVREFSKEITPGELFSRIFRKKEAAVVPGEIIWDGRERRGLRVKDGIYSYRFHAWDTRDNISVIKKGRIAVDTVSPEIKISAERKLIRISPHSQDKTMVIKQRFRSGESDIWTAGFRDREGDVRKSYRWTGKVPPEISWDGKGENGEHLPDGSYTYFIRSTDRAGNRAEAEITGIIITRNPVAPDLELSHSLVSYKKIREIELIPYLSKRKGLERWSIDIRSGRSSVKKFQGEGRLPASLKYDLTAGDGRILEDGLYRLILTADYGKKRIYTSPERELRIDTEPPRLSIGYSPGLFSPDNDGQGEILAIFPRYRDRSGPGKWVITIYTSAGKIFKTFSGERDLPEKILWNGKNYKNELVESAADYFIEFSAEDAAGNISRSAMKRLPVDVLVLETGNGYSVEVSRIDFQYRTDRLRETGEKILERIYEKIEKYGNCSLHVFGHTDDLGSETENLKLSEKRAERVMRFLIQRGIPPEKIRFTGMGETQPLFSGTGEEERRRNRRIVIRLEKNQEERPGGR